MLVVLLNFFSFVYAYMFQIIGFYKSKQMLYMDENSS